MKQQLLSKSIKKVSGLYFNMTRNTLLSFSFLLCTTSLFAQEEFSFELFLEDASGNNDTLVLGYDLNGSTGIDPAFNEVNIISQQYNSGLDVRKLG